MEGKISRRKFVEVLKGSGAEFSAEVMDVLIGKMAQKAEDLNYLSYEEIFTWGCDSWS